ncbi:MAG: DUF3179 domain-containing protein [Candidatus Geothermarchaeales archaeon]
MRNEAVLLLTALTLVALPSLAVADHVGLEDLHEVLPRDAIPAIRNPTFAEEDYLGGDELVVGLEVGTDARAYPVKILNHHEIVNDVVGGVPVAVTFCPLCNTAIVYDRRVDGQVLTFGVSGLLFKSNLVMYDEETESLWVQITSEAIQGPLHGAKLETILATVIEWNGWKARYPESLLFDYPFPRCGPSRQIDEPVIEGSCIDYDVDPYGWYVLNEEVYFGAVYDDRILHPKAVVLGLRVGSIAMAYPYEVLANDVLINDQVNGLDIVVAFHDSSAKAFERRGLTFQPDGGRYMKDDLGRKWDVVTGEGEGGQLEEVPSTMAFWFAWAEFNEGTGVYGVREPLASGERSFPLTYLALSAVALPGVAYYIHRRRKRRGVSKTPPEQI